MRYFLNVTKFFYLLSNGDYFLRLLFFQKMYKIDKKITMHTYHTNLFALHYITIIRSRCSDIPLLHHCSNIVFVRSQFNLFRCNAVEELDFSLVRCVSVCVVASDSIAIVTIEQQYYQGDRESQMIA